MKPQQVPYGWVIVTHGPHKGQTALYDDDAVDDEGELHAVCYLSETPRLEAETRVFGRCVHVPFRNLLVLTAPAQVPEA